MGSCDGSERKKKEDEEGRSVAGCGGVCMLLLTTEPPGPRSRESGALFSMRRKVRKNVRAEENDKKHAHKQSMTYAETA